jgi:hypothetical protein
LTTDLQSSQWQHSQRKKKTRIGQWAGRYTTQHTGNHRQLDASGNDMQNIARQATTARNAPIEVAPTARQHTGKTKQANIYDTAMIDI